MSGDVFGNGMLLSPVIRLVAAFDHRHVFIDPDPDPGPALAERQRLFELAGSSWDDYDRARISTGGGVWPRSAKCGAAVRTRRGARWASDAEQLSPNELLPAILRAPVDLFWNGGIGTFVKAGSRVATPRSATAPTTRSAIDGARPARAGRRRGRQPGIHAARPHRVRRGRRAHQHRRHRQLRRRRLLRPRGQPEDPARPRRSSAGDLTRKQRDELLARSRTTSCGHVLYDNYLQAQILSQEAGVGGRGSRPTRT